MSIPGIRFISSATPGSGNGAGIGLSAIRGPTGPAGAFGGPQGNVGIQGPQGLIGSTGSIGPQGLIGLQGLIGSTGSIGPQGLIGSTGSIGPQGLIGSTGSIGPQGLIGSTGSIGPQGGAGMGFVVFANTTSYTGLNTVIATGGNIGQFVLVLGGQLFVYAGTGSGYTGPDNSYGYAGDVTDESKLVGLQGNVGSQGSMGATGTQGLQGLMGTTGSQGLVGLQGLQGQTGAIGPAGYNAVATYNYKYSSTTTFANPGQGLFRISNANMGIATGMYINSTDGAGLGNDLGRVFGDLNTYGAPGKRGFLKIQKASDYTWYFVYEIQNITQQATGATGWYSFDLNCILPDANFTNNDDVYLSLIPAGPPGITGPTGSIGPQGLAGSTGSIGLQGYQGTTGSQGYQGLLGYQGIQGIAGPTGVGGALGYYGSFYDTTIQAITIANTGYVMTFNSTSESNGIFVSNGSRINFQNGGVYNLQFSAQFDKTDSGTDTVDVWMRQNGVNVPWTNTRLTSVGNNDKMVAAWNFMQTVNGGDYLELVWMSNDIGFRIYSETGTISPVRPGIPSVILTVQQVMNTQLGPQGLVGFTGSIGPQGLVGLTGPTGSKGDDGPQGLVGSTGSTGPQGLVGSTGSVGPQGIPGTNGSSSSLTLYLDTQGGSYAGVALTGTLMTIPNQSTQTTITSGNQTNTTINIANFLSSGLLPSTVIQGGNWDLALFGFANASSSVSFYFENYYVDSDGVSNQTLIAAGTGSSAIFLGTAQALYINSLYVPTTILPDTTKRILLKVFLVFSGNNKSATIEFRDGTISHLHTTILSPNIAAGQSSQIIFNQSGAYTGSSNLTYNGVLNAPNIIASSGSFTNLLVSSGNIMLGGSAGSVNQRANSVAIGNSAGQTNQGTGAGTSGYSVAIGHLSGNNNQGYGSVSVGYSSGQTSQGELSVAIGTSSGNISQGTRAVGIGQGAGYQRQGNYAISMGDSSGQDYQGTESVSIGRSAGLTYQNPYSVAVGSYAGSSYQSTGNVNGGAVSIGSHAGQTLQQYGAVSVGYYAGNTNQGANSIAIGANAGYQNQANNSIVINASGNQINGTGTGFFVNPVRNVNGGNLLTYNTANSEVSYSNTLSQVVNISANNNATGSATGALIVTGGVNVNGESVFNNLVYAPQLNPNFINRGNPGQASPLLLSNYNTVHYYSTTSATGFVDISTTMVENAVYEVEFNCYGASSSNDDMFLYPNYNFTGSGGPFYNVYTQSSGSPGIQYASSNSSAFYFDYVSGSIGFEPVGKIKIYNNRSAKKVKVEIGDTTAIVNGQGYWTAGAGFTSTSVSAPVYDTTTQWLNVGRLQFSASANLTFTNWNIWVKRIM